MGRCCCCCQQWTTSPRTLALLCHHSGTDSCRCLVFEHCNCCNYCTHCLIWPLDMLLLNSLVCTAMHRARGCWSWAVAMACQASYACLLGPQCTSR